MIRLLAWALLGFELGYHRDLSRAAAGGFSRDAQRLIVNANLYVDVKSVVTLLLRRKRSPLYRQHFDDCFNLGDHLVRWRETEERLSDTAELGSSPAEVKELAQRLGSVHHSGQDYYAHSDHVEHLSLSCDPFQPATHAETTTESRFEPVRTRWRTDGLKSGAYFEAAPIVGDIELHHRTLNTDRPNRRGEYLYAGALDRSEMHRRAMACATRETERLNDLAAEYHSTAFAGLSTYRSGLGERLVQAVKYGFAVAAAAFSGHWR